MHLFQEEECFRWLVQSVQDYAIYMLDPQGYIVSWNGGAEKIKGYRSGEIIGRHFSCFFTPEAIADGLPEQELSTAVLQGKFECEGWRVRADGSRFWANVIVSAIYDENNQLRGFAKVTRDITERQKGEIALREAKENLEQQIQHRTQDLEQVIAQLKQEITSRQTVENRLRESESLFRGIFDQAAVGISQVSLEGQWLMVNQRLCDIVGYSREDLLSKNFQVLTHPDDLAADLAAKDRILTGEMSTYSLEKRYIRADGAWVWVNLTVSLVYSADGSPKYFISVIEDITDRKGAEWARDQSETRLREKAQQLAQTLEELRSTQAQLIHSEKMSALGPLVAGLAHEINNPVTFIQGNLRHANQYFAELHDLIQRYQAALPEPPAAIQETIEDMDLPFVLEDLPKLLESMDQGTDRILQIVTSLRSFARHDEAEWKTVSLHDGIHSALCLLQNRLRGQGEEQGIEVVQTLGDLPPVTCYARQLNQAVMNILDNAIDALASYRRGSRPPQIRIATEYVTGEGDPHVVIRIADNGAGMSAEVQALVFDPFFTTKPVGQGQGLGLTVAYQIVVQQHGGRLFCCSTPDQGTEFTLEMPVSPRPSSAKTS